MSLIWKKISPDFCINYGLFIEKEKNYKELLTKDKYKNDNLPDMILGTKHLLVNFLTILDKNIFFSGKVEEHFSTEKPLYNIQIPERFHILFNKKETSQIIDKLLKKYTNTNGENLLYFDNKTNKLKIIKEKLSSYEKNFKTVSNSLLEAFYNSNDNYTKELLLISTIVLLSPIEINYGESYENFIKEIVEKTLIYGEYIEYSFNFLEKNIKLYVNEKFIKKVKQNIILNF